jgi:hypothetical protein
MFGLKTPAVAALLALGLAGCAPRGPSPEVVAAEHHDYDACAPLKTHVERAKCRNAVAAKYIGTSDLLSVLATERVALAEQQDAGKMTQAEADAEFAKVFASVNTQDEQRRAAIAASMPVSCTSTGGGGVVSTMCY